MKNSVVRTLCQNNLKLSNLPRSQQPFDTHWITFQTNLTKYGLYILSRNDTVHICKIGESTTIPEKEFHNSIFAYWNQIVTNSRLTYNRSDLISNYSRFVHPDTFNLIWNNQSLTSKQKKVSFIRAQSGWFNSYKL